MTGIEVLSTFCHSYQLPAFRYTYAIIATKRSCALDTFTVSVEAETDIGLMRKRACLPISRVLNDAHDGGGSVLDVWMTDVARELLGSIKRRGAKLAGYYADPTTPQQGKPPRPQPPATAPLVLLRSPEKR